MNLPSTTIHYVSLYYFIVILSVNGFVQSFHKGLSEGLRCSLNQPTGASREKYTTLFLQKASLRFFNGEGRGRNRMSILGATLPPAGYRNPNAASPEENSSFRPGFRAEDWTAWTRKLRGMPVRTRERKGISRPGPAKPLLDSEPSAEP